MSGALDNKVACSRLQYVSISLFLFCSTLQPLFSRSVRYIYIYILMYVCMYGSMYVYMYVCMVICMYV